MIETLKPVQSFGMVLRQVVVVVVVEYHDNTSDTDCVQ